MSSCRSLRICAALGGVVSMPLQAQVVFPVSFEGVPIADEQRKTAIESNLVAAAEHWAGHFDNAPASIEIVLRIDYDAPLGLGSGNSVTIAKVGEAGERTLYEQSMAHELRTGRDPNGADPDVLIVLHPDYLSTFWLDPDPRCRTAPVPPGKLDAVTVFLHELGHAIAFNGWLDPSDGSLDGEALSTYDRHVRLAGADFLFAGPNATRLHGDSVPLARTRNNYHHVGDSLRGPDDPLADDLMNGVTFEYGRRYAISALDLAILADAGVPVKAQGPRAGGVTGKQEDPRCPRPLSPAAGHGDCRAVLIDAEPGRSYRTEFVGTRRGYDASRQPVLDGAGEALPVTQRYSDDVGTVLASSRDTSPEYDLNGDEIYVRARVVEESARSVSQRGEAARASAWTQPVTPSHRQPLRR